MRGIKILVSLLTITFLSGVTVLAWSESDSSQITDARLSSAVPTHESLVVQTPTAVCIGQQPYVQIQWSAPEYTRVTLVRAEHNKTWQRVYVSNYISEYADYRVRPDTTYQYRLQSGFGSRFVFSNSVEIKTPHCVEETKTIEESNEENTAEVYVAPTESNVKSFFSTKKKSYRRQHQPEINKPTETNQTPQETQQPQEEPVQEEEKEEETIESSQNEEIQEPNEEENDTVVSEEVEEEQKEEVEEESQEQTQPEREEEIENQEEEEVEKEEPVIEEPQKESPPPIIQPNSEYPLLWGAYAGWKEADLLEFVAKMGESFDLISTFVHWGNNKDFPTYLTPFAKDKGRTMVIFWEASDYTLSGFEHPQYSYDAILNGNWNAYLDSFAQQAKLYAGPVILIPFSEMNGNWSPWAGTLNGNTPEKAVAAYRHVKARFAGVTNVKFGWAPNSTSWPNTQENQIENYYPGDAYVDYVGVDGFNFGNPWKTFDQVFGDALTRISKYNKPMYVFSMGSMEGAQKAAWITDALTVQMPKYPLLKGWVWFNENKERDWRLWSDAASLAATKEALGI